MRIRAKVEAMAAWDQTAVTMSKGKSVAGGILSMGATLKSMNVDKRFLS